MKAKEKLRVSLICNTSELQTDDEEQVIMRKRKSKPRIIFGDTDSDSEADEWNKRRRTSTPLPPIPPPTLNEVCQTTTRPLPGPRHTTAPAPLVPSPPPYILPSPPHHFSAGHRPDLRRQSDRGCDTAPMSLVDTPTRLPSSPVCRISATPLSDDGQDHLFVPSFRLGKTGTGPVPCSMFPCSNTPDSIKWVVITTIDSNQMHILTLLEHIKQQQMQLAAAVNSLAARVGTETPVAEMPDNMSFPLATMSEVEELEEWLKDSRNSHAKQNMISALGAVGGQNTKRISWNVLSKIFSDTVAKRINWKGVNGKKCFKEMLTRTLLIKAVRKNHQSAPDSEIDSCAIRWFNLASDRGGGHKDRAMAKETSTS
ncbi:uncharacterized protein LOC134023826 [Osmerus eperlanus]|uniref:uncharacterized protein LOC134023826 n=1 Tax=Osmerus eperlanus TaxID=29151 RepID=UPI002E0D8A7B